MSVNDLVIKSAALALRDVPEANAKWNRQTGDYYLNIIWSDDHRF